MYIDIDGLFRWCACLWNRVVAWVRLTIRNYLSAYIAFSATPSSDRYAVHVSVDMTACPWKFNYGLSNPRHHTTRRAPHPSRPHRPSAFVCMTCGPPKMRRKIKFLPQPPAIPTTPLEPMKPHVPRPAAHPSWPHCPSAFGSITCGPVTYRVHMLLTQR